MPPYDPPDSQNLADFRSYMLPEAVKAQQTIRITIENRAETTTQFVLQPLPDQVVTFEPPHETIQIAAGDTNTVDFKVVPPRRELIGGAVTHPFSLEVRAGEGSRQVLTGQMSTAGLIPPLGVGVILLFGILLLCGTVPFLPAITGSNRNAVVVPTNTPAPTVTSTPPAQANPTAEPAPTHTPIPPTSTPIPPTNTPAPPSEPVRVAFGQTSFTINETQRQINIAVRLNRPALEEVRVNYTTRAGSATPQLDYLPTSGTLTFRPGELETFITVRVNPDNLNESDESIIIDLTNPVNAMLDDLRREATLVILDAVPAATVTPALPQLNFEYALVNVNENTGEVTVLVQLSQPSNQQIRVDYMTRDGSALAGQDYDPVNNVLIFEPTETSRPITVFLEPDSFNDFSRTFEILLTNPQNAQLGPNHRVTINIVDDDGPTPTPTLTSLPVIQFSQSGYTLNEGGGSVVINVLLSHSAAEPVSINYNTSNGSALAGSDYVATNGTLVFNPGETNQAIVIPIIDDNIAEATETFSVFLSSPQGATLGTTQTTVTILDNDNDHTNPTVNIRFAVGFAAQFRQIDAMPSYTVAEDVGTLTINIDLSQTSNQVVQVSYYTQDSDAIAGQDYSPVNGTLVFNPGQTRQSFTLAIFDDSEAEDLEVFDVLLTNPINGVIETPAAVVLIRDND